MIKRGNKQGQLTLIIIFGIIIVGAVIGAFLLSDTNLLDRFVSETNEIEEFVDHCVQKRGLDAIRIIGLQGGYINLPEKTVQTEISDIAFGYIEKQKTLPSKEFISEEIDLYIEETIKHCVTEDDFVNADVIITDVFSNTVIAKETVNLDVKMTLLVNQNNKTYTIDKNYKHKLPIKLGNIHSAALEIIDKVSKEEEFIDVTHLYNLGFNILFLPHDENVIIYAIMDNDSIVYEVDEVPYSFLFATKLETQV